MIIPQIYSAKKQKSPKDTNIPEYYGYLEVPTECPICGYSTEIINLDGCQILTCANPNCEGKLINRLDHFCGKKGLDIKGISKATLQKLINWGWIKELKDIFNLNKYKDEWINKEGFGEKSVSNILNQIEETSKNTTLVKFLSAIGIPLVGTTLSKELVKYCSSYDDFRDKIKSNWDFTQIDGVAYEKANAITSFNYNEADVLNNIINIKNDYCVPDEKITLTLEGKNIVITGKLNIYSNRAQLQNAIESKGGKVTNSVTKNTHWLINNDINSTSSKNKAAIAAGVPIISEQEFFEKFLDF